MTHDRGNCCSFSPTLKAIVKNVTSLISKLKIGDFITKIMYTNFHTVSQTVLIKAGCNCEKLAA